MTPGLHRRMDRAGTRMHDPRDDVGERTRGADRRLAPVRNNGAGNGAGVTLFAQRGDDGSKVALGGVRDHIGRTRPVAAHAHVERAVEAE